MNLAEANAVIGDFEKRYPFIKVKLNRIGSEKLLTRVLTEARAKKIFADVIQTVEFSMHIFSRSGILARYTPQANSIYPKEFKEEGFWTTVYYNAYVTAYNTRLVATRALPKSYDDLLDPKWKGALMMEGTKADWFAGMLQILGQERGLKYMRALAKQQPSPREGHELLAQLVVAGEGAFRYQYSRGVGGANERARRAHRVDGFRRGAGDHGRHRSVGPGAPSERGEIVFGIRPFARRTKADANSRTPHRPRRSRQ